MTHRDYEAEFERAYKRMFRLTGGDQKAASNLMIASMLQYFGTRDFWDSFGHELSLGIRHGLMGGDSYGSEDIRNLSSHLSGSIEVSNPPQETSD